MPQLVAPEAEEGQEKKLVNNGRPVNADSESEVTAALVTLGEDADEVAKMEQADRAELLKSKHGFTVGEL